jgi:hypothetical protein
MKGSAHVMIATGELSELGFSTHRAVYMRHGFGESLPPANQTPLTRDKCTFSVHSTRDKSPN